MKGKLQLHEISLTPAPGFPFAMGALTWRYTPELLQQPARSPYEINFNLKFADGFSLGDAKYESLLGVVQKYLRHVWLNYYPKAMYEEFISLRPFLQFVVEEKKVNSFREVWDIDGYIFYIKEWLLCENRKQLYVRTIVKPATLYGYLHSVKKLWVVSRTMPDGLREEPWVGKTSTKAAGLKASRGNAVLPYSLPEFYGLVHASQMMLGTVTQVVNELQSTLGTAQFSQALMKATLVRNSAALQILAFTSIRPETLVSLPQDALRAGVLATEHGEMNVVWLCGRIFKDRPVGGEPWRWVASDEVVTAGQTLLILKSALNACAAHPKCRIDLRDAVRESNSYLLPKLAKPGRCNGQLDTATLLQGVKNFVGQSNFPHLPAADDTTMNRFRPTLARVLARLGLGDIRYFMHHYGHKSISTTQGYFSTFADDEFKADVAEATNSEMQAVVHDILSSKAPLAGKRGKEWEPLRREYAVMTFKARSELLRHFVNGYNMKIQPHSFCIAPKSTKLCPPNCIYEETRCLGCHNGIVAPDNLFVWQDMQQRVEGLSGEFPIGSPAHQAWLDNLADIKTTIATITTQVEEL